ncbi:hypothetical protein HanPSC8_Chr09g0355031 [Helianthus annuus]|nr:hypothetical protein HanPSC8_Chr09g0355031 [Helianthus annuus]
MQLCGYLLFRVFWLFAFVFVVPVVNLLTNGVIIFVINTILCWLVNDLTLKLLASIF